MTRVAAAWRSFASTRIIAAASARPKPRFTAALSGSGWRRIAAYATAAANRTRATANQAMLDSRGENARRTGMKWKAWRPSSRRNHTTKCEDCVTQSVEESVERLANRADAHELAVSHLGS